jgi:hypothetical protein
MTEAQQAEQEKDLLYAVHVAERDARAFMNKLSLMGQEIESLGRALQEHPEEVTPLPEPHSMYDYRAGLNLMGDRKNVISLCNEYRSRIQKVKVAKSRIIPL